MLGSQNYNNNNKDERAITVFSQYGFINKSSKLEKSKLSVRFWNNMLCLTINIGTIDEYDKFIPDKDNKISIYLTHTKAKMLYDELVYFNSSSCTHNSVAVDSGEGVIYISNGKEFSVTSPVVVIGKVNSEGSFETSYAYELNKDYHYVLRNVNLSNMSEVEKIYNNSIEMEQLMLVLKSYYESMTYASAYSTYNTMNMKGGIIQNIEGIASSLGVSINNSGYGGYKKSFGSYIDNSNTYNNDNQYNKTNNSDYVGIDEDIPF